jgi:colanic acid biosynthesis protein WcaH
MMENNTDFKIPKSLYKQIIDNIPILCVDLIIYSEGKVLLVYRKEEPAKNKWWTPGGRVYKNESLQEAVLRKAYEEAGIKVKIKKQIGIYEFKSKNGIFSNLKNGFQAFSVAYLVELKDKSQKVSIDSTSKNYRWIDKIEKSLHPFVKKELKDSKVFK